MWNWFRCFFLGHDWENLDKEVQRPLFEKMLESSRIQSMQGYDRKWAEGTVVWLVRCRRCTRVKTIREEL